MVNSRPMTTYLLQRGSVGAALILVGLLFAAPMVQAADKGPRAHAEGKYDSVTATYVVAEGDDLFAISERFEIPVGELKANNKLTSNEVEAGQKLSVRSTAKPAAKKPLAKMTCEDFLGLDESFQPKAVYWAVAYGKHGTPDAEAMDVDGVETVVPVVIDECKKAPKESFWQKVEAQWDKLVKEL
jgi:acid stress chaperone HdeA